MGTKKGQRSISEKARTGPAASSEETRAVHCDSETACLQLQSAQKRNPELEMKFPQSSIGRMECQREQSISALPIALLTRLALFWRSCGATPEPVRTSLSLCRMNPSHN